MIDNMINKKRLNSITSLPTDNPLRFTKNLLKINI